MVNALILSNLTSYTPPGIKVVLHSQRLKRLKLADPSLLDNRPIDLLLGVGDCSQILLEGIVKGSPDEPIAQETIFGWVLFGKGNSIPSKQVNINFLQVLSGSSDNSLLQDSISKFWELEEVPQKLFHSEEDLICEQHFLATHKRTRDGRYEIA